MADESDDDDLLLDLGLRGSPRCITAISCIL